jgi:thioredoxin reductase (NADPH)
LRGSGCLARAERSQAVTEPKLDGKALLCVVHDDAEVRGLLARDLVHRFGSDYDVEAYADGKSALAGLRRRRDERRRVAAVFSADNDACGGETFRVEVHDLHPAARRVALVGRGAWNQAHPAVAALRTGQAESYIFVPWVLRERWLYLPVSELLADWEASQRPAVEAMTLIGEEWEPRAHTLRALLSRLGIPFGFHRPGSTEADRVLEDAGIDAPGLPILSTRTGRLLVDPSSEELASTLGFSTEPEDGYCDLAIVGADPAGLAAAVYGASEGLATVVVEEELPGGQAGTSSRIRNYLGFPMGLSGRDLANRALEQAWFFGARFVLSKRVTGISPMGEHYEVELQCAPVLNARTVIVATGVTWRRLDVPALEALQGAGVYYGAAASDARTVQGADVFIVGAGNSAGQAAVHLAGSAASVTLLARGERLADSMSDYLVRQLEETPNVLIRVRTEVTDAAGSSRLTGLTLRDTRRDLTEHVPADAVYIMIGAHPHTDWLAGTLGRDENGYILTGEDIALQEQHRWPLDRPPMLLETTLPGVFAAGDVCYGSVKRVASAVGNGSIAVQLAHRRLAELS